MEYRCLVGGAKLIVIMGQRSSGMVNLAIEDAVNRTSNSAISLNLRAILSEIQKSIEPSALDRLRNGDASAHDRLAENVLHRNVKRTAHQILSQRSVIRQLVDEQKFALVGAVFNPEDGLVQTFETTDLRVNGTARVT